MSPKARNAYQDPERKRSNPITQNYYPLEPNDEFLFVHFPNSWQHIKHEDGRTQWLPLLSQVPLKRGCNGIIGDDHDPTYRDPSQYVARAQRNGATVIYSDDKRLGRYKDYVCTVPCQHNGKGGTYHLSEFETIAVLGGKAVIRTDMEGYWTFLQYLVDRQIVAPMSDVVLDAAVQIAERRVSTIQQRCGANPHLAAKLKAAEDRLIAMPADWRRQFAAEQEVESEPITTQIVPDSEMEGPAPRRKMVREKGAI